MKILNATIMALVIMFSCMGAKCTKDVPPSHIQIDPSLKVRCPELPYTDPKQLPMGQLLSEYSKLQGQYIECAIRNDCLIEATDDSAKITCPALDKLNSEKPKNVLDGSKQQ